MARDHAGCEGGAAAARSSAALGLPPLLHGYEVHLAGAPGMWRRPLRAARRCLSLASPSPRLSFNPAGEFANLDEVAQLLKATGAKQLSRPPAALHAPRAGTGPCTSFLLCEGPEMAGGAGAGPQEAAEAPAPPAPPAVAGAKWYQRALEGGVAVVSHRWLLDSISAYTPQPLARYRL